MCIFPVTSWCKEDDKDKEEGVKDKENDKVENDNAENEEDKRHDKNEEVGNRVVEEWIFY